jgi:formylmethanofuran dehydrogenase subunit E
MIDTRKIQVRHTGQGGVYGEPIDHDLLPWSVMEEIADQIAKKKTSGEVEVGGQRYLWVKAGKADMVRCEACGEMVAASAIADPQAHNTGGERQCLACHEAIIDSDSDLACLECNPQLRLRPRSS